MRNVEGAKAGSNQKKPYRAPVSVTSTQRMRIKYGISEGTIRGFSAEFSHNEMLKRIYLDGTPIMSAEGEQLLDVVVEFRDGSRDQEPINGLPSISVEHDVGVEVKIAAPVSRSFDRADTTSYDVRISVPTLYRGDDEGNSEKGLIQFKIDVSTDGGAFEEAGRFEIYEKILNGFAETYNVVVPKGANHVVRISRLNSEVVSDYSVNRLVVEAISENTDVRLRYTNTAVLYLEYDAEQFSNVPKLEMRVFGKNDILVPANYNGDTHTYATSGAGTTNGVWDGTWKRAYTDNPVWISLDLMISRRYGLGDKIDLTFINKWELYGLAQYCDEAVADGKGGFEPRFTCNNMYLQKSEDAYRVLKDLAASFRAKVVWDGEFITLQADVPRDPVHTFSNANASDITYSSTQDSAQRNLINVQYYDRDNKFASDVVMQRSNSNILSRGKVVDGNFTALGCASQGQAQRIASYVMNTELYETELVSFTTGLEGGLVRLNDVIQMADNSVAGQTVGGRIAAVNGRSITLDRKIPDNVQAIATTQLSINRQDVKNEPISIVSISDDRMTAVLASDAPAGTEAGLVWALLTQDLVPQKFVVTDIEFDSTNMTFALSAIQYNESKYAAIDGSARIVVPPISVTEYKMLKAPIIVIASYLTRIIQDAVVCDIDVSWAQSTNAVQYQLEMQKAGSDWRIVGRFMSLATTLDNMYTGTYTFRVCAYDSLGNASQYTYSDPILVAGKVLPPPALAQYSVVGILFGYQHKWIYPAHTEDSRAVRLRFTTVDPVASPSQEWQYIDVAYPTANFTEQDVSAGLRTWFSAAIVDKYGNVGAYTAWQSAVPSVDATQVLDLLDGQLTAQQLDQDLTNKIAIGAEAAEAAESAQSAADAAAQAAANAQTAANGASVAASNAQTTASSAKTAATTAQTAAATAQTAASNAQTTASNAQTAATNAMTAASNAQTSANDAAASVNALATEVDADITALSTDLNTKLTTLGNGLTQETTDRQNADTQIVGQLNAYKTSNDAAVAGVLQKAEAATTASTANAQALTNLTATVNTKNRTYRQTTAPTTGRVIGDLWINTTAGKNNEVRRWNGTAWDDLTDPRTAANATALTNLQTTVTAIDGRTTANANSITQLRTDLTTLSNTVGTKADASALTSLQATVTQQGNDIVSNTTALTSLQSQVTTNTNNIANKLDASVITNYYTKTEAETATAGAIQAYNANLVIGGVNQLINSEGERTSQAATNREYLLYEKSTHLKGFYDNHLGKDVTVSFDLKVDVAGPVNVYSSNGSAHSYYVTLVVNVADVGEWKRYSVTARPTTHTASTTVSTLEFYGTYGTGRIPTVRKVQLEAGNKATAWSPSPRDTQAALDTNAAAITQTQADVTTLNGTVTSQGTQLTNLASRVTTAENGLATKADATALTNLTTRVTNAEGNITSQGTRVTNLENSVNHATTGLASKASSSALTAVDNKVTAANGRIDTTNSNVTTLTGRVSTVEGAVATKAEAAALTALTTRVTNAEGVNTSQGSAITTLQNTVNHATTGLATKASTSALTATNSEVTRINGVVTGHTNQLTQLTADITTINGNLATKADASALNDIYTKTQADTKATELAAGEVSKYDASLVIGGVNLVEKSKFMGGAQNPKDFTVKLFAYPVLNAAAVTAMFTEGETYTISFDYEVVGKPVPSTKNTDQLGFILYSASNPSAHGNPTNNYLWWDTSSVDKPIGYKGTITKTFKVNTLYPDHQILAYTNRYSTNGAAPFDNDTVRFTNFQIENGTKATAWSPSPNDIQSALDANSTAIQNTNAKVTRVDGVATAANNATTTLAGRVSTVEGAVATKAEAAALTSLTTRVTNAEGVNTSQGTAITTLQNTVNHATTGLSTKASSAALTTLDNKVTAIDGRVTSNSSSITSLNNSLTTTNTNVTAAQTAATNAMTAAGQKGKVIFGTTVPAAADQLSQNLWIDTTGNANTPKRWNGTAWVVVTDKVATDALAAANAASSLAATKADSSALTALDSKVTTIDGKVTTNASNITTLQGKVTTVENGLATKAEGSALSALTTRVTNAEGVNTSQGSAITTLQNTVNHATTGLATKASSTALTAVDNRVTAVDGRITTTNSNVTTLTGRVSTVESGLDTKADVNALTALGTTVTAQGNDLNTKSNQITELTAGIENVNLRGQDLVSNGLGQLQSNKYWSSLTFTAMDKPAGVGSFVSSSGQHVVIGDEFIAVDPARSYKLAYYLRQTAVGVSARGFGMIAPYDVDKNLIVPDNYMVQANTLTTLAVPLKKGDTTMTLTSAANWYNLSNSSSHLRSAIFWNYTDKTGYTWPVNTYSRNVWRNLYDGGAINGDVITLKAPWSGLDIPAGTQVSNGSSGGTYMYIGAVNPIIPQDWTAYSGKIEGTHTNNLASATNRLPMMTAYVKVGFLFNRSDSGSNVSSSRMAVGGVSIRDWSVAEDPALAKATALTSTDTEVSRINGVVVAQGTSITKLQAGLTTTNNNVATKADGAALTSLTTRVSTAEGNITSQSTRITNLENSVNSATNGLATKASSTALSTLDNKVTGIDGRVTANATQLTQLNSSLTTTNNNVTAAQNAADAAALLAGSKGKVLVQTAAPAVADRLVQNLWIDITGNANTPKRWNGSAWVAVTDKVATDAAAAAANALSVAQTKADATALTSLTTRVDTIDGKVTAQATQLSSLSTTVGNNTASITSQQTSIDGLSAKATIQVAAGNTVGGVSLGNSGGVVDFIVRTNTFAVAPPVEAGAGNAGKYAFNYRATPTTLPNGTVVAAGLYLNNLIVDYIDASKIYAESLSAISGTFGTITTLQDAAKPLGVRTVMTGGATIVYDDNNIRRARFGFWSD